MDSKALEKEMEALRLKESELPPLPVETPPVDAPPQDENPWQDPSPPAPIASARLKTPDPSLLDDSVHGLETKGSDEIKPQQLSDDQERDILAEFDPMVAGGAGEVWADSLPLSSEKDTQNIAASGTPPPPDIPPSPPSKPPALPSSTTGTPTLTPSSSSTLPASPFPSIAALARSFSIPKHKRPMSIDGAAAVPSPRTLSGFAAQQDAAPVPVPAPAPTSSLRQEAKLEEETGDGEAEVAPEDERGSGSQTQNEAQVDPPFDFQKFLDQMKTRPADPVSKYLKSFLTNFSKRTFTVADQIRIINDFMVFIAKQMREVEVWQDASDVEFENAMEGMEKLVMNQLYQYTFTPAIAQTVRRGSITADDLERDRVLSQRIMLFRWIEPRHLDLPVNNGNEEGFLAFAQQELLKVNSYKAPRDKLICILNCCKVIFGLIRHLQSAPRPSGSPSAASSSSPKPPPQMNTAGADEFIPFLIYVVVKANPAHLMSNINFITRFRSPDRMGGESMYYLSSLEAAVSWVESLGDWSEGSKSGLTVTKEEFEENVERAIREMEESGEGSPFLTSNANTLSTPPTPTRSNTPNPSLSRPFTPDALSLPAVERLLQKTSSAIGRMFNEVVDGVDGAFESRPQPPQVNSSTRPATVGRTTGTGLRENAQVGASRPNSFGGLQTPANTAPPGGYQTPYKPRVRRVSPSPSFETPSRTSVMFNQPDQEFSPRPAPPPQPVFSPPQPVFSPPQQPTFAQPQPHLGQPIQLPPASTLSPEETAAALDTLLQIFPGMDREIVEMVLDANGGDVGRSVEGLLEMSVGA